MDDWEEMIREAAALGDLDLVWAFSMLARIERQAKQEGQQVPA